MEASILASATKQQSYLHRDRTHQQQLCGQFCRINLVGNLQLQISEKQFLVRYKPDQAQLHKTDQTSWNDGSTNTFSVKSHKKYQKTCASKWNQNFIKHIGLQSAQDSEDSLNSTSRKNKSDTQYQIIQLKCSNCKKDHRSIIDLTTCNIQDINYLEQLFSGIRQEVLYYKIIFSIIKNCQIMATQMQPPFGFQNVKLFIMGCTGCKNADVIILADSQEQKQQLHSPFTQNSMKIIEIIINKLKKTINSSTFNKISEQLSKKIKQMQRRGQFDRRQNIKSCYNQLLNYILKITEGSQIYQKQPYKPSPVSKQTRENWTQRCKSHQHASINGDIRNNCADDIRALKSKYNNYVIDLSKNQTEKHAYYKLNNGRKLVSERYEASSAVANCSSMEIRNLNKADWNMTTMNKCQRIKIGSHKNEQNINQTCIVNINDQQKRQSKKSKQIKGLTLKDYIRVETQNKSISIPKKRSTSKHRLGTQSIKTTVKKENLKLLKKQKQNENVSKQLYLINRLKQIRHASNNDNQVFRQAKKGKDNIPWNQISIISKQIAKLHIPQVSNIQPQQNQHLAQNLPTSVSNKKLHINSNLNITNLQNSPKQTKANASRQGKKKNSMVEYIWSLIEQQLINYMNPVGQCINSVKQLCKQYGINSFIECFLLYKKFFYMRTTFQCCLLNTNEPIIPTITLAEWQAVCSQPQHSKKVQKIQQQNKFILHTLQKMQKKIHQNKTTKTQKINPQILKVMTDDQSIYDAFCNEMIHSNIAIFMQIYKKYCNVEHNVSTQNIVLKEYGNAILMVALSEVQGSQQNKIREWLREGGGIQNLYQSLLEIDMMFQ